MVCMSQSLDVVFYIENQSESAFTGLFWKLAKFSMPYCVQHPVGVLCSVEIDAAQLQLSTEIDLACIFSGVDERVASGTCQKWAMFPVPLRWLTRMGANTRRATTQLFKAQPLSVWPFIDKLYGTYVLGKIYVFQITYIGKNGRWSNKQFTLAWPLLANIHILMASLLSGWWVFRVTWISYLVKTLQHDRC